MKNFIVYTRDGYTEDNNFNATENMQILGFTSGETLQMAYETFNENRSHNNNNYSYNEIILQEIIGNPIYI